MNVGATVTAAVDDIFGQRRMGLYRVQSAGAGVKGAHRHRQVQFIDNVGEPSVGMEVKMARAGSAMHCNVVRLVGFQSPVDDAINHHLVDTQIGHIDSAAIRAHGGGVGVGRFLPLLIGAAAVVLNVLHRITDGSVCVQWVDRNIAAVVVGHDERAAARFNDQVAGRGAVCGAAG